MEKHTPQAQTQAHAHTLPDEARGQTSHQLKGIRLRKWGSWVSEIRMPKSRAKIWLGSYKTAEQAARAYDAALYCLRGPASKFNFPDSLPLVLPESSLSRQEIQDAAAKHALALAELPSIWPSMHSKSMEEPAFPAPLQSSSDSEMELSSDEEAFWKSLFAGIDGAGCPNFAEFPLTDESLAWDGLFPSWQESYLYVDPTELWNCAAD